MWGRRRNTVITFGAEKNRMVCLSAGEKSLRICLFVSTQYKNVTDRRTDRRRATAKAALMHNIARQKPCSLQRLRVVLMVDSINNAAAADLEPTILHPGTLGKLFYLQYWSVHRTVRSTAGRVQRVPYTDNTSGEFLSCSCTFRGNWL